MLPRAHRLSEKKDFKRLSAQGKTINLRWFRLKWLENPLGRPRFGIVISKKAVGLATSRNLLKRKLSNAIAGFLKNKNLPRLDLILSVRPIEKKDFKEAVLELEEALKRLF